MDISRIYANQSQPNEKSFGWKRKIVRRRMRKSSAGKSPKTSPKQEKKPWKWSEKSQNGRFGIHLATIKKLQETLSRFTGTARHAPHPTELPAKRQPKPSFPYKQETAKPMRIVYFPPRPHSSPNERLSKGRNLLFDILPFPSPDGLLIHWKCTARPVWHPQRISGFHGKTNCCKTR